MAALDLAVELSARWVRAVRSIRDFELRTGYLRDELTKRRPAEVAGALDDLADRAEQADAAAREVLIAAVPVLCEAPLAEMTAELAVLADRHALLALGRLLRRRRVGHPSEPPPPDDRPALVSSNGRPLTLGERKSLARRPSRPLVERLLRDPHPHVIRAVLANPRVTEDDVVRVAARRPAWPDVLAEIAKNPHWGHRPRVRMTIVQNPSTPPELAVPLVRLLIRPELVQIAGAADVPRMVRAAASELLARRPPVPSRRPQGQPS